MCLPPLFPLRFRADDAHGRAAPGCASAGLPHGFSDPTSECCVRLDTVCGSFRGRTFVYVQVTARGDADAGR